MNENRLGKRRDDDDAAEGDETGTKAFKNRGIINNM